MSTILFLLTSSFLMVYACMMVTFFFYFRKPLSNIVNQSKQEVFVSVIIPVRNEANNINRLLTNLNNQSYSKSLFEVILVDDHSADNSIDVVNEYRRLHPEMQILTTSLSKFFSKKMAITTGISLSKGELIVTTDGDCHIPPEWLFTFANYYKQYQPQMIIGPVSMIGKGSFFDNFQQYDYMAMMAAGLASNRIGLPLVCSGANLAFSKQAFEEVGGYSGNEHIASGDDVFLMLKMKKKFPDRIHSLVEKAVIVNTPVAVEVMGFFQQRIRWGNKMKQVQSLYIKLIASIIFGTNFLLLASLCMAFFIPYGLSFFIVGLLFKTWIDLFLLKRAAGFFSIRLNPKTVFLTELIYPFYCLFLILFSLTMKVNWKGREIRN